MTREVASLLIENVSFSFGRTAAVSDFSLKVKKGSFTTLLGPSGCGKTTLLRLISGFILPDKGCIKINGVDQAGIAPEMRKVGMVFQDYALFPHMTVEKNLLYGLALKNPGRANYEKNNALIHKTARVLGIAPLLERYPHELSGGQQQRLALGRALVLEPQILLMDEPLSSLDAKLRTQVREELKEIQSNLGITTVYVTHDQEEALSLSDEIAVLNHGKLLQCGSPREIYFNPKNDFVADFVGRANFIQLRQKSDDTQFRVVVRPEWIDLIEADSVLEQDKSIESKVQTENLVAKNNCSFKELSGTVLSSAFLGHITRYRVRLDDGSSNIVVADLMTADKEIDAGKKVFLRINRYLSL